jgi:hypothetical protein
MRGFTWLMERQLEGIRVLSHWIYGKPRADEDFERDLAEAERDEDRLGKSTLRGEMLRFERARRGLITAIFKRKDSV